MLAFDLPPDSQQRCKYPPGPWRKAIGSCRYREQLTHLGNLFAVLETVRKNTQGKRFNLGYCILTRLAIAHNTRKLWHLRYPAAVLFGFDLNLHAQISV